MRLFLFVFSVLFTIGVRSQIYVGTNVVPMSGENYFLDVSTAFDLSLNPSPAGKGLVFPRADLTDFYFKTDLLDGYNLPGAYDGMIVYNIGTGETIQGQGQVVYVYPGFYYFYNPEPEFYNDEVSPVANGRWVRLYAEGDDCGCVPPPVDDSGGNPGDIGGTPPAGNEWTAFAEVTCQPYGITGDYYYGIAMTRHNKLTVVLENTGEESRVFDFQVSDVTVDGILGIQVGSVNVTQAILGGEKRLLVDYLFTGTPSEPGILTAHWSRGGLSCTSTKTVIEPTSVLCGVNGISGEFYTGVPMDTTNRFSITLINNMEISQSFSFSTEDLVLSGVSGIYVASVNLSQVVLSPGQSLEVIYYLEGTPLHQGTLEFLWENQGLRNCLAEKTVVDPVSVTCNNNLVGDYFSGVALNSSHTFSIELTNNRSFSHTFLFGLDDLSLLGISGIAVTQVTPASLTLESGQSGVVTYNFNGVPQGSGIFTTIWNHPMIPILCTANTMVEILAVADCGSNGGLSGTYLKDWQTTPEHMFSMSLTNMSTSPQNFIFLQDDLILSGINGLSVETPVPDSVTLMPGETQLITYNITGTPNNTGTLSASWSKEGISGCSLSVPVTLEPTSVACDQNGFNGIYYKDWSLTELNTFTMTLINNTSFEQNFMFSPTDLVLSGVSGISVSGVSHSSLTIQPGGSQLITYYLDGIPVEVGILSAFWSKQGLRSCVQTVVVTLEPTSVVCGSGTLNGIYYKDWLFDNSQTLTVSLVNNTDGIQSIGFSPADVTLSGVNGITIGSVSPANITLGAGQTQQITYHLSGTPLQTGTLTAVWSKPGMRHCLKTASVTLEPVSVNCSQDGFSGIFYKDWGLTEAHTFTVSLINNTENIQSISFSPADVVLNGVSGVTIGMVSPSSVTLGAGQTQQVTYHLNGTPVETGILSATWSKGGMRGCIQTVEVTLEPTTVMCNQNGFTGNFYVGQPINQGNTYSVTLVNNSQEVQNFSFNVNDLTLLGGNGVTVHSVQPSVLDLQPGSAQKIDYILDGTPTEINTLTANWTLPELGSCSSNTAITQLALVTCEFSGSVITSGVEYVFSNGRKFKVTITNLSNTTQTYHLTPGNLQLSGVNGFTVYNVFPSSPQTINPMQSRVFEFTLTGTLQEAGNLEGTLTLDHAVYTAMITVNPGGVHYIRHQDMIGHFVSGANSTRSFMVEYTNNTGSTRWPTFKTTDIQLSGISGLSISSVSLRTTGCTPNYCTPFDSGQNVTVELLSGQSVYVTYTISGTPSGTGELQIVCNPQLGGLVGAPLLYTVNVGTYDAVIGQPDTVFIGSLHTEIGVSIQGIINNTDHQLLVHVPYSGGSGSYPAYTGEFVIGAPGEQGDTNSFRISYPSGTFSSTGGTIPVTINVDGDGVYTAKKLPTTVQQDIVSLPFVLNGTVRKQIQIKVIGGVPDKYINSGRPHVYAPILSPTGKIWLRHNLGAAYTGIKNSAFNPLKVPTSVEDTFARGHFFQWGRDADGHEITVWQTTTQLSSTDTPGHGMFILSSTGDWRSPSNNNLWQASNGFINDPCPEGFRLPTQEELMAEMSLWSSQTLNGAFSSVLKIVQSGYKEEPAVISNTTRAYLWTSTTSSTSSRIMNLTSTTGAMATLTRKFAAPVRCIKR